MPEEDFVMIGDSTWEEAASGPTGALRESGGVDLYSNPYKIPVYISIIMVPIFTPPLPLKHM